MLLMIYKAESAPIIPGGFALIPPSPGSISTAGLLGGAGAGAAATSSLLPIFAGLNNIASGQALSTTLNNILSG